jgi:predicted Zn-dependent protease with MMP-like domain
MTSRIQRREFVRRVILETLDELPSSLRDALDRNGVTIDILAEPPSDVGADVFGTFSGGTVYEQETPLGGPVEPARIELYLSSFDEFEEDLEALEDEVRLTVIHEIGHFFGFDEDYLEDV